MSHVPESPSQKLQKVLAGIGLGSRREIEGWIQSGRCRINQKVAQLGDRVTAQDKIFVDNRRVQYPSSSRQSTQVLLYHKRPDEICTTRDPEGRVTVFKSLPNLDLKRWVMVGRLDYTTSGLLLFTTDGLLAHRLLHPSYEIEREYLVRVHGLVNDQVLSDLKKGAMLDGQLARFSSITESRTTDLSNSWYRVILKEGRQREVRRLFDMHEVTVTRLKRIRFGNLMLPHRLKMGDYLTLNS